MKTNTTTETTTINKDQDMASLATFMNPRTSRPVVQVESGEKTKEKVKREPTQVTLNRLQLAQTLAEGMPDTGSKGSLTPEEKEELKGCEKTIEKNIKGSVEAGKALLKIQSGRLYRETHKTFGEYCGQRLHISRSQAYRMIDGTMVAETLASVDGIQMPTHESQTRCLAGLKPAQMQSAWQKAVAEAKGGAVSAAKVREAAAEFLPQKPAKVKAIKVPTSIDEVVSELAKIETAIETLINDGDRVFEAKQTLNALRESIHGHMEVAE